ncbi:hypothetical protein BBD42_15680 [Paenibacillus sp. BIHB 4019]|uniref:Uncharacterized protein n=1 Tax=Paenibacillus sp. BIHB 4019 TaxID=1870819 RepID=A0A1B2DJ96_9BACL|nr:hypothetical protein [Paenibacillus sp. BIHB 4019]ANY67745.1 hypothetical protein BBD42_15680 [Paenibacillus sp. BIHB 4019]
MIVHANGSYETGEWLTADTYPNAYYIADDSELAAKVRTLYPYYTLVTENGALIDVTERAKTPEEEAALLPQKSPEELRIESLEADNVALMTALADVYEQLIAIQTNEGGGA